MDAVGEGEGGVDWESATAVYTATGKQVASGRLLHNTGSSAPCSVMTWRVEWGRGWQGSSRGCDICSPVAGSLRCTVKINTTLKQLYSN